MSLQACCVHRVASLLLIGKRSVLIMRAVAVDRPAARPADARRDETELRPDRIYLSFGIAGFYLLWRKGWACAVEEGYCLEMASMETKIYL